MYKYDPLYSYLSKQTSSTVVLSFEKIESILGDKLPKSAYTRPQWWSNSQTKAHPYSRAWQDAGYKTTGYSTSIWDKEMTFVKE